MEIRQDYTTHSKEPPIMAEYEIKLTRLNFVAHVLHPLKLIVWGNLAVGYLGVPVVHDCYMLGVRDEEMKRAAMMLADAGFIRQSWSFGSKINPATRKDDEMFQRLHAKIRRSFARFDARTIRFYYMDDERQVQPTILIPWSYLHLAVHEHGLASPLPPTPESTPPPSRPRSQPPFYVHDNLYYPNVVDLLRSIVRVYLEEREYTDQRHWQVRLSCWAFGHLYGELQLRDDVLDDCEDAMVKECFDRAIQRGSGRSRVREKWGVARAPISNDLIKEFQIDEALV